MKILVAGANGLKNLGDDSYKVVIDRYFNYQEHELLFDSPYPDSNSIKWADFVIIGGGGLIYDDEAHFKYMTTYIQDKPFGFLSCGVQLHKEIPCEKQLLQWQPFLNKAEFITLRSKSCQQIIQKLCPEKQVFYFPDLAYLTPPTDYQIITTKEPYGVIIPTHYSLKDEVFAQIENFMEQQPVKNVFVLQFSNDDKNAYQYFIAKYGFYNNLKGRNSLTPSEAVEILRSASWVITSRFHGYVLSRAGGLCNEQILLLDDRYKSQVEDKKQHKTFASAHLAVVNKSLGNVFNKIENTLDF